MHHQHEQRGHRSDVDLVGLPVQRQDDQREQQRDRKLDADGDVGFAQSRQQHHHRADAGEYQHESGGKRRQHGDVDTHLFNMPQPPMIRDEIRIMWL
jgi:hypothetical protein